jgi:hypothetical protein
MELLLAEQVVMERALAAAVLLPVVLPPAGLADKADSAAVVEWVAAHRASPR